MTPIQRWIPMNVAYVVGLISAVVLIGWIADIPLLESLVPGLPTMKFLTALSFLLSALLLFFIQHSAERSEFELSQFMLAIITILLLITLGPSFGATFLGIPTGLEDIFDSSLKPGLVVPFQQSPSTGTTIGFIFVFLCGVGAMINPPFVRSAWKGMGALLLLVGGLALVGYLIREPTLYYLTGRSAGMAIHTAICFVLLGIGFVSASYTVPGSLREAIHPVNDEDTSVAR